MSTSTPTDVKFTKIYTDGTKEDVTFEEPVDEYFFKADSCTGGSRSEKLTNCFKTEFGTVKDYLVYTPVAYSEHKFCVYFVRCERRLNDKVEKIVGKPFVFRVEWVR